ncbi:MAG: hypothetical protein ABI895_01040 [Deltaproteobacteria bacterium]
MQDERRSQYLNRGRILKLLSDEEIAQVSQADNAVCLSEGDEYLDLGELDRGVRQAQGTAMEMRHVLPRKAVGDDTWSDILVQLAMLRATRPDSRASHGDRLQAASSRESAE